MTKRLLLSFTMQDALEAQLGGSNLDEYLVNRGWDLVPPRAYSTVHEIEIEINTDEAEYLVYAVS